MSSHPFSPTHVLAMSRAEFAGRFGTPDVTGALCGYTREADTHAVLTLLAFARPRRVLEVGTALGHMTANFTRWTLDDAQIFSMGIVQGMQTAAPGAREQQVEHTTRADFGRFAGQFGKARKVFFITADSMLYDFGRLAPLEFTYIDGGHDLEHALNDSRKAYEALTPGGWLVWHDFNSVVPWVEVRAAIERLGFSEPVVHVEGTEVAFLRKEAPLPSPWKDRAHPGPVRVAWEGDPDGLHSLALVNRALCRALLDRGHDVGLIWDSKTAGVTTPERLPLDPRLAARLGRGPAGGPAQVHVRHQWPPKLEPPPQGRWVLMQPWEYGSLPKAWLPALRRVDEVWAYSRSVRDCYLEAGVPQGRVHVIPLGIDPEVFRPGLAPLTLPSGPDVRFLFVGGTIFRKGIDLLLSAFARAFQPSDGVGLVIKDMGTKSFYRGQTAEAGVAGLRERGYSVDYIDRSLGEQEIAGLYAACDCLVLPFRGEGFALPVVEAMACGLPVIVTGAGPALDYASEETAFLIPARRGQFAECRVGDLETIGRPWLSEPDPEALVEHLRRVAADPASARARGSAAAGWVREHFTWSRAAEAVESRLHALAGEGEWTGAGGTPAPAARRSADERAEPQAREPRPPGPVPSPAGRSRSARTLPSGRPKASLTAIVRNEENNLSPCLESVAGLFDEIVIVDTGSTDRTIEIARSFGARVFDFVWVDDFAAARNAALARATGDYAFWLDADDVVDPPEREKLEALLDQLRAGDEASYVVRCKCDPSPDGSGGDTVVDHIRLFPLREDVRWTYRIHEQILPALRRAKVPVRWPGITVRHTGYVDQALRSKKLDRDSKILRADLEERPDDPFTLFNLGAIANERKAWNEALGFLQKSLALSAPSDSIVRKLYALIARAHQMLGETQEALDTCARGLALDSDDGELWFRKAFVHRHRGESSEAEACWRRILRLKRPDQFCSLDQGIYGHLTLRNLAALAAERGDHAEARRLWQAVLAECPGDREALARLQPPTDGLVSGCRSEEKE